MRLHVSQRTGTTSSDCDGLYVPLGVEELVAVEGAATPRWWPSLTDLLRAADGASIVLLAGTGGSGKTVEAVRAFRELERDVDCPDAKIIPVWLSKTDTKTSTKKLNDFLNWVAAAAQLPQGRSPEWVYDLLRYFPRRLAFFADLTVDPGSQMREALSAATEEFGHEKFGHLGFVLIAREHDSFRLPAWRTRCLCRVRPPDDKERENRFHVRSEVWNQVETYLDDIWRTPLVYSFLAQLAQEDQLAQDDVLRDRPLTSISETSTTGSRDNRIVTELREPGRAIRKVGGLSVLWSQSAHVASPVGSAPVVDERVDLRKRVDSIRGRHGGAIPPRAIARVDPAAL